MVAAGKMSKYLLASLSEPPVPPMISPRKFIDLPTQYRTYPNHLADFALFLSAPSTVLLLLVLFLALFVVNLIYLFIVGSRFVFANRQWSD